MVRSASPPGGRRKSPAEAKGLVERVRDTGDRRSVRIRLTPHGHEVTDRLFVQALDKQEQLLQALDPAERDQLAGMLRTLLESLGDTTLKWAGLAFRKLVGQRCQR